MRSDPSDQDTIEMIIPKNKKTRAGLTINSTIPNSGTVEQANLTNY